MRRAVGSLDTWPRSLADIADGLGTLKADTIDLLVRSLPDITEEYLAFEAAAVEASEADDFDPGAADSAYPSPERSH